MDDDPKLIAEISSIVIMRSLNPEACARRILRIPAIREALYYLDQRKAQGVPLAAPYNGKAGDDAR